MGQRIDKHEAMIITTALPLQSLFFKHWHTDDQEVGVLVSKARFLADGEGRFRPASAPPDLHMSDIFAGDPATSALLHEQDIAPAKAATDLLIHGIARSPDGVEHPDWAVSVSIPDRLTYGFHVRGPCQWERRLTRWRLSTPTPVTEVPLSYAQAYGGAAPGEDADTPAFYEFNPAGQGFVTPQRLALKESFAAPQIGELAEFMAPDIHAEMTLHGVMPLAKAWLPRRSNAGTFDEDWQRLRHPRMPHDYSLRFWNCAPAEMQIDPYLIGNEAIHLSGLSHGRESLVLQLPGAGLCATLSGEEGPAEVPMILDTVVADVTDGDPDKHQIDMVWRCLIREPQRYRKADVAAMQV